MVCLLCRSSKVQIDEAYMWRMTGEVPSYKEIQRDRVLCTDFKKYLAKRLMVAHHQMQHGVAKGRLGR